MKTRLVTSGLILRDFRAHGDALWARFNRDAGKIGILGYYRGLVMAFEQRADQLHAARLAPLIADLKDVVTTLEREVGTVGKWPLPNVATGDLQSLS